MPKQLHGGTVHRSTPAVHHKTSKRCNGSSSGGRGTNGNTTNLIHSTQTVDSVNRHESKRQKMDWDLEPFDKLHPNENAQRIMSRYKMILKGKNTVGYSQYVQQVPKQQRHIRSMDTPQTPDHTLDIPAKRWQGLVKAWRVALHKYDPPDLVTSTTPAVGMSRLHSNENVTHQTPIRCVSTGKEPPHDAVNLSSPNMNDTTPCSVAARSSPRSTWFDDGHIDKAARNLDFDDMLDVDADDALGVDDPDDSDDDLL